jgi:2-polyprenyl-3-methyl-5-hydroxy-6-metoxy-1,4-benzoquinol methylase
MRLVRQLANALLFPIRRILDPRFHDVTHRVSETHRDIGTLDAKVSATMGQVENVAREASASSVESVALIGQELRGSTVQLQASIEGLRTYIDAVTMGEHERFLTEHLRRLADGGTVQQLDGPSAELIDYALSHRGFEAQARLWMNPPLVVHHSQGAVELTTVNERIIEVPFAFRALQAIPVGGKVLDFGAAESTVSLSLASMGYDVTAIDLTGYPLRHPNLTAVTAPLEHWDVEEGSFDGAVVLSTIEHVGLGWYGEPAGRFDDRGAMVKLGKLVKPGGTIVLTTPYGTSGVDDMQRRYDQATLAALLEGFEVVERIIAIQQDPVTWVPVDETTEDAVALVTVRVPAS